MEELRRQLLDRAFLYDHPASYRAGVEAALQQFPGATRRAAGRAEDQPRKVVYLSEVPDSG